MSFNNKYMKGPIRLLGASPFTFNQNGNIQVPHNIELAINRGSGSIYPGWVGNMTGKPTVQCETTELARVLGTINPLSGLSISSTDTYTGADFYFMKRQKAGTLVSGSTNLKLTTSAAMAVIKSISADQDKEAKMSLEFYPYSTNGTTAQLSYTTNNAALQSVIPSEKFTLGPVLLNGTEIDGLIGVSIDFAVVAKLDGSSGALWPEWTGIESVTPKITFKTRDLSLASTVALLGLAQGATQTDIYFRKLALGGGRTANVTTEHIRVRVNASQGMHVIDSLGGSEVADAEGSFIIQPHEGWIAGPTLAPVLSFSVAAAIP